MTLRELHAASRGSGRRGRQRGAPREGRGRLQGGRQGEDTRDGCGGDEQNTEDKEGEDKGRGEDHDDDADDDDDDDDGDDDDEYGDDYYDDDNCHTGNTDDKAHAWRMTTCKGRVANDERQIDNETC